MNNSFSNTKLTRLSVNELISHFGNGVNGFFVADWKTIACILIYWRDAESFRLFPQQNEENPI